MLAPLLMHLDPSAVSATQVSSPLASGATKTRLTLARAACPRSSSWSAHCQPPPPRDPKPQEGRSRVPRISREPFRDTPSNSQGPQAARSAPAPPERPQAPPRPGSPGPAGAGSAPSAAGFFRPPSSTFCIPGAANAPRLPASQGTRGAPPARPPGPRSWPTWPRARRAEFAQVASDEA